MINLAVSQADLSDILVQGIWMLGIALLSGGLTLLGSWLCARLSADFGRDLRVALYDKTLSFSTTDFETFGTASMITRTLNDINVPATVPYECPAAGAARSCDVCAWHFLFLFHSPGYGLSHPGSHLPGAGPPPFSLSGRPPAFLNCSRVFWTG